MIDLTWTTLFGDCTACFTGLLFLVSASHKLMDQAEFSGFLADYRFFPARWVDPVSWGIIGAEFAVPLAFLQPKTRGAGTVLAIVLLLSYALGMAVNLYRGRRQIECGCAGPVQHLSGSLVVRNLCLAATTFLILLPRTDLSSVRNTVTGLIAGVLVWSVYAFIAQVISNQSQLKLLPAERP